MDVFPLAKTPREKFLLIGWLIHGFHWYCETNGSTLLVTVNLIVGKSFTDVVIFLDTLTYNEKKTLGIRENLAEWDKNVEDNQSHPFSPKKKAQKSRSADADKLSHWVAPILLKKSGGSFSIFKLKLKYKIR